MHERDVIGDRAHVAPNRLLQGGLTAQTRHRVRDESRARRGAVRARERDGNVGGHVGRRGGPDDRCRVEHDDGARKIGMAGGHVEDHRRAHAVADEDRAPDAVCSHSQATSSANPVTE